MKKYRPHLGLNEMKLSYNRSSAWSPFILCFNLAGHYTRKSFTSKSSAITYFEYYVLPFNAAYLKAIEIDHIK